MALYNVENHRNGSHTGQSSRQPDVELHVVEQENTGNLDTRGFSRLSQHERYMRLLDAKVLTVDDIAALQRGRMLATELADSMIENHIGSMEIPIGPGVGIRINGKLYTVPMCIEESSVVAAVCKTAKWIEETGEATAEVLGDEIIGQIQFPHVANFDEAAARIAQSAPELIAEVNERVIPSMAARGGGVTDIQIRCIPRPDGGNMAVVHVAMKACNAMGANIVTQVSEYLRGPLEDLIQERANMAILSNLADRRLIRSSITLHAIDPAVALGIQEASIFAEVDPYRAATHNKGIMNGIDPIVLVTGNDWRAVEAGAHAFAARSGQYRALSTWRAVSRDGGQSADLIGSMTIPMAVGTVGGVTRIHPTAQLALRMMDIHSADELAQLTATVGLIQNLGALRALTTDGLVQGHMRLHLGNIIAEAGATQFERSHLHSALQNVLRDSGRVTTSDAHRLLKQMRER